MNIPRSELHALRSERRAYAQAVLEIREATGLHDVPLDQLPAMVEQLLSELADRQIRRDIEPVEPLWLSEDVVVPAPAQSCAGCLRLMEIDGRLTCNEHRSLHSMATIIWPGPGCVWGGDGDSVYGGSGA